MWVTVAYLHPLLLPIKNISILKKNNKSGQIKCFTFKMTSSMLTLIYLKKFIRNYSKSTSVYIF